MDTLNFFEACILGDLGKIKADHQLPVNEQDGDGRTGLMLACWYNRKEVINYLLTLKLDAVCDKNGNGYQYYFDNIGLGLEIHENRMSMTKILIDRNIDDHPIIKSVVNKGRL